MGTSNGWGYGEQTCLPCATAVAILPSIAPACASSGMADSSPAGLLLRRMVGGVREGASQPPHTQRRSAAQSQTFGGTFLCRCAGVGEEWGVARE